MTRRHRPVLFALAMLASGLWLAYEGWSLQQIVRETARLESIRSTQSAKADAGRLVHVKSPRLQFAEANRLIRENRDQRAEQILATLARDHDHSPFGLDARFNLANLYLRRAMVATDDAGGSRTLVELAKQGYRELLRLEPDYWPARYNLEQALRLAPETVDSIDSASDPVKRVDVIVPDFENRDLP